MLHPGWVCTLSYSQGAPRHVSWKTAALNLAANASVMSCASSEGLITTNGMSLSKRDKFSGNAAFQADLAREVETLEGDLDVFGFYPAISVGVRIRF